jgi:hypothetical protein
LKQQGKLFPMPMLSELKPKEKERVGDLLKRAGITVQNNRHFLSKCAFIQGEIVVLNFWYENQIKQQSLPASWESKKL